MTTKAMRNAIKDRLIDQMSPRPDTAWPNVSVDAGILPRLEVDFYGGRDPAETLKGGELEAPEGSVNVKVVTERGKGENDGLDYAEAVKALFPAGQRISFTGGTVVILEGAEIRDGYPADTCWYIPVIFKYRQTA